MDVDCISLVGIDGCLDDEYRSRWSSDMLGYEEDDSGGIISLKTFSH